jgi:hypothetical protein
LITTRVITINARPGMALGNFRKKPVSLIVVPP